jgi:hypothetical protein
MYQTVAWEEHRPRPSLLAAGKPAASGILAVSGDFHGRKLDGITGRLL